VPLYTRPYLCVFHVLQAWLLKVQEKLKNKSLFKEAFGCLHALMSLRTNGRYEERKQAVQQQLEQFKAAYTAKGEHALLHTSLSIGSRRRTCGWCRVYRQNLLRLNCTLEDQPQSYIDHGRVLPFCDSRLKTPTHFKTLISLGSSAPRPGAPIRNFMVYVLGHKGTMAQGTKAQPTTGNNPLQIRKT
jgi:hypothetical protein